MNRRNDLAKYLGDVFRELQHDQNLERARRRLNIKLVHIERRGRRNIQYGRNLMMVQRTIRLLDGRNREV